GSRWFDLAEHLTGLRVTSLCVVLQAFHRTLMRSKHSVETFANKLMGPEDFGAVIFRMGTRTRGCMSASQVSAGRKNGFRMEIYGSRSSVAWNQERPDELWV